MSSKHRKVRSPIARMDIIEKKKKKLWKEAKKRESEDKMLKWLILMR